jgi:hypothetical protein
MLAVVTVNVDFDEDDGIGDNQISLRDAVLAANPNDTIEFNTALNGATIDLSDSLGEIAFGKGLTIDASVLSNGITIDAGKGTDDELGNGDGFRIFHIVGSTTSPPVVTMKNLTLKGGDVSGDGGAIFFIRKSAEAGELHDRIQQRIAGRRCECMGEPRFRIRLAELPDSAKHEH